MKIIVLGCSKHKGEYEGRKYDYTKLYVVAPMEQSDDRRGSSGVDLRALPELFDVASKIDFKGGIPCEVTTELRALGGSNSRETVVSIQPINKG